MGNALTDAPPAKPASMSSDMVALRGLAGLMNNPEISGAKIKAPPVDQLLREAQEETASVIRASQSNQTTAQGSDFMPPQTPAAPIPAPVEQPPGLIMFTGRQGAQPEEIARRSGVKVFNLSDFITLQLQEFGGTNVPISLLAEFKAIGEAIVTPNFPFNLPRVVVIKEMRRNGFKSFGNPGYWIKSLVEHVTSWTAENQGQVIVTGISTIADFNDMKGYGFVPFHVMCSNQTAGRVPASPALAGDGLEQALDNSVLRQISQQRVGPTLRAIWNDSQPMPAERFLTPETFAQRYVRTVGTLPTGTVDLEVD